MSLLQNCRNFTRVLQKSLLPKSSRNGVSIAHQTGAHRTGCPDSLKNPEQVYEHVK